MAQANPTKVLFGTYGSASPVENNFMISFFGEAKLF